jgi:hypothetical protein
LYYRSRANLRRVRREALGAVEVEAGDQIPFKSQNRYSAVRVRSAGVERVLVL